MLAHAIGHNTTWFGGRTHHKPTGAHTEAVDAAAIGCVMHQLVFSGSKQGMASGISPAGVVDQRLRMLDPKTNREGLPLHGNTDPIQHREGVPRRMSRS